jgi:SNF2 domain-containing protein/helicase-like protein
LCVLQGRPTLYLTADALFSGPDAMEDVLDPGEETRIPAPAIERDSGVSFLHSLGVELPPRVRERVRRLACQVTITCELRPTYVGSNVDDCILSVSAVAPDGYQQAWNGYTWDEQKPKGAARKKPKSDNTITVYDTAHLVEVPGLLRPLNLRADQYRGELVMRMSKKFAEVFVEWLKTVPSHITVQLKGELASLTAGEVVGSVKLEVTEQEIDWFDLRVVLDVADTTLSAEEIKLLLNAKGGFVRLRGKGWRRLQYDLGQEENDRLARLGLSARELSAEPQRLHALQLADDAARKFLPEQQVEQIQRRASEIKARVAPDLPAGITAQLRPYQLEGFHFLAYLSVNRFGGILADDMGLGKTLQTLAWVIWLREQRLESNGQAAKSPENAQAPAPTPGPVLVVCPKSVMDNWQAEAARFAAGLRVKIWPAGDLEQMREKLADADVHVLNYSQLRLLGESLTSIHWLAVVLDEGQYIKNPNSQTAQVARSLRAEHRLVLSGTPIENRLLDLWSLMVFTMPGVLSSRAQFARLYDAKGDPLARRRLAARVRPFLLRRTKAQVAKDLPDRIEEDLFCEIEGEQKALYRAELKAAQQLLLKVKTQKELAQQQFHFLTSLLRLRQICCHPRLIKPDSAAASAKTESLLEQLEPLMEEGQKVLVFSQFVQMLDLLRPILEERQWPVFYLAGQTENRGELVQKFQSSEGPGIFLISLKAGGFGLNLTAASYVVLFDPWWNPAVENQAIDRTHRIGQTNKVIAYRLLIKNSIEEKIRELQKHKKALVEDVLGEEKFAQSLTLEDLHFLLAD